MPLEPDIKHVPLYIIERLRGVKILSAHDRMRYAQSIDYKYGVIFRFNGLLKFRVRFQTALGAYINL